VPSLDALVQRTDRGKGVGATLLVPTTAREVIEDRNLVALL